MDKNQLKPKNSKIHNKFLNKILFGEKENKSDGDQDISVDSKSSSPLFKYPVENQAEIIDFKPIILGPSASTSEITNQDSVSEKEESQEISSESSLFQRIIQVCQSCCMCKCQCPKNPIWSIIKIWFFPWTFLVNLIIPWSLIFWIGSTLDHILMQIMQPLKFGKFGLKWIIRIVLLLSCIVFGIALGFVQYGFFYMIVMPVSYQDQQIHFTPGHDSYNLEIKSCDTLNLSDEQCEIHLQQQQKRQKDKEWTERFALTSFIQLKSSEQNFQDKNIIKLSQETYDIEVVFDVAETHHNMEQGNIYLSAKLNSNLPDQKEIQVNRMGTFDYKGRLQIYLKEFFSIVPFGHYALSLMLRERDPLALHQKITIQLVSDLDNSLYQLQDITLGLNNKSLQYKSAHLRFVTNLSPYALLYGFRYFMREWFISVATISISSLSIINSLVLMVFCYSFSGCCKSQKNTQIE